MLGKNKIYHFIRSEFIVDISLARLVAGPCHSTLNSTLKTNSTYRVSRSRQSRNDVTFPCPCVSYITPVYTNEERVYVMYTHLQMAVETLERFGAGVLSLSRQTGFIPRYVQMPLNILISVLCCPSSECWKPTTQTPFRLSSVNPSLQMCSQVAWKPPKGLISQMHFCFFYFFFSFFSVFCLCISCFMVKRWCDFKMQVVEELFYTLNLTLDTII